MNRLLAVALAGALVLQPALARASDPPSGPAAADLLQEGQRKKLAGILTADIGVGGFVLGLALLISAAAAPAPQDDFKLRRDLEISGGFFAGLGATAMLVGTLVWLDGLRDIKEGKSRIATKPSAMLLPTFSASGGGAVLQVRY